MMTWKKKPWRTLLRQQGYGSCTLVLRRARGDSSEN